MAGFFCFLEPELAFATHGFTSDCCLIQPVDELLLITLLLLIVLLVLREAVVFVVLDKNPLVATQEEDSVREEHLAARNHFLFRVLFRLRYQFHYQHVKGHIIPSDEILLILLFLDLEALVVLDLRLACGAAGFLFLVLTKGRRVTFLVNLFDLGLKIIALVSTSVATFEKGPALNISL